jgi:hypothetical protein
MSKKQIFAPGVRAGLKRRIDTWRVLVPIASVTVTDTMAGPTSRPPRAREHRRAS